MDPFISWDLWLITVINIVDTAQDNVKNLAEIMALGLS